MCSNLLRNIRQLFKMNADSAESSDSVVFAGYLLVSHKRAECSSC